MPDEQDATGSARLNMPSLGTGFNVGQPDVEGTTKAVTELTAALAGLKSTLGSFSANPMMGNGLTNMLRNIRSEVSQTTKAVSGMGGGMGGGGGGGGSTIYGGASGGGGGDWASDAQAQAREGGIAAGAYMGTNKSDSFLKTVAMTPIRYLRDTINTNRSNVLAASTSMSLAARQQFGVNPERNSIAEMLGTMAKLPGNIYGTPQELIGLFGSANRYGASYNFGGQAGGQGVRAGGFFAGIQQAQAMNPGANVQDLANMIGGYAANTQAQQRSIMLTGGAFSMITGGGRQKSLSQWAESVLKWLKGLRPGADRGKDFSYGQLMAQYFPGSNIDAWFDVNGVPQNMREYWWTYALQRAQQGNQGEIAIGKDTQNLAQQRMEAATELTRNQFQLGSAMGGAYLNREQANKWFNQFMGQVQQTTIPALASSKIGGFIQYLPDTIESMLMQGLENLGKGDVGDVGDGGYGDFGGTGLAGLSLNMRSKLGPMMKANPRLRVTSGLRDNAMQKRLKGKGYSRVSGGPSAHTRGDAADLGPSSEYGWIMANASKFGLKSGKNQGEPWHVGVGDEWDDFMNIAGSMGTDSSTAATKIAQIVGYLFGKIADLGQDFLGSGTPQYNKNVYSDMVKASQGKNMRGVTLSDILGGGGGSNAGGWIGAVGGSLLGGPLGGIAGWMGGNAVGNFISTGGGDSISMSSELGRAVTAAKAASAAGFHGKDLFTAVSISGRESGGWNPNAYNGNRATGDKSYGLMQINMIDSLGPGRRKQFGITSNEELWDPYKNMAAAYSMYAGRNNTFYDWGPYKGMDPLTGTEKYQQEAFQAIQIAGVGDVEQMQYVNSLPTRSTRGGTIQFNNTFAINGGSGGGYGGIDVRRTVNLIADQLEDQMQRRLARVN